MREESAASAAIEAAFAAADDANAAASAAIEAEVLRGGQSGLYALRRMPVQALRNYLLAIGQRVTMNPDPEELARQIVSQSKRVKKLKAIHS